MRIELVSIETDTYPLDGLYYTPEDTPIVGAAMIFHGNCMNFYTGAPRFLPPVLARLGYAVLTFNRRGHDIVATLNSRASKGGAFQIVSEMIADNRYAAQFLASRGFDDPMVIGHSNGGMLAVRHVADHPRTPALILLSAHTGGPNAVRYGSSIGLLARDRLDEITAQAEAMVAAGRGNELLLLPGWWYVVTAKSFLDYSRNPPEIMPLAPKIRCPTLYICGDKEPPGLYPAEAFAATAGGYCQAEIVKDCDHFYTGKEREVSDLVRSFLRKQDTRLAA